MQSSKDFLILADRDKKVCDVLEKEFPDEYAVSNAGYHIQQAIEKVLKGLILIYGQQPQFTHNITKLVFQCENLGIPLPEQLDGISEALTMWESESRYDPFVMITEKKYNVAKSVFSELRELLDKELKIDTDQTDGDLTDMKIE